MGNFNKKPCQNNRLKAHCLIFFILCLLLVTPVLVNSLEIDNLKGDLIIDNSTSKYGKITIWNWNVIGKLFDIRLVDLELKKNSDICRGKNCDADLEIIMYKEGALIDEIRFIGGEILDYNFKIRTGGSEWWVDDYVRDCVQDGTHINGTEKIVCNEVLFGGHYENNFTYKEYIEGEEVEAGTYNLRLEGTKKYPKEMTDWIIKTQGKEMTEWAAWNYGNYVKSWDTSGQIANPYGGTANATTVFVQSGTVSYLYSTDGAYKGSHNNHAENDVGRGMCINDSNYFVVEAVAGDIFKYDLSGNYVATIPITPAGTYIGCAMNGSNFFLGEVTGDAIYKFTLAGGSAINVSNAGGDPTGLDMNGSNLFVADGTAGDNLLKIDFGGGTLNSTPLTANNADPYGMGINGTFFFIGDYNQAEVYVYYYGEYIPPTSVVTTTLNSPVDYYNSSSNSVTFNCSTETDSLNGETIQNNSLYFNITGTWTLNETINYNGNTVEHSVFTKNIPEGKNWEWTCQGFDNTTSAWATNRSFSIDTTYPQPTINLPSISEDYGYEGMSEELNYSITEINYGSSWYNYNGTNLSLNGAINLTNFTLKTSPFNITIWANDSAGNQNSTTRTFGYKVFENNRTFENTALSFDTENFLININYNSTLFTNIVGKLIYNLTSTSSTKSGAETNSIFSADKIIPQIAGTINKTFYWSFTLTNSSGSSFLINTTSSEQAVTGITFALCNGTNGIPYLNFTFKDELNSSSITGTLAATFNYWLTSSSGSSYASYSFENTTQNSVYGFCVNPNYTSISINMDAQYGATGYEDRTYYFNNYTLTNTTSVFNLSLLNTSTQTKFYITVKDGIDPFTDAFVYVYKYYTGTGNYNLVGIRETDSTGEFVEYLELDEKYNFGINKSGINYGNIFKTASCSAAPCELTLQLDPSSYDIWEEFNEEYAANIVSNITFNLSSKVVTYKFTDTTGTANYFRFIVGKMSFNLTTGNTICDEYLYASGGTITCNVTGYTGDFIAKSYISRSPEILDKVFQFIISDAYTELGLLGIFLNVAILITMVFATAVATRGSPSAVIFVAGITILLLKIGGLFPYSWYVVTPIELVILWLLIRSEK